MPNETEQNQGRGGLGDPRLEGENGACHILHTQANTYQSMDGGGVEATLMDLVLSGTDNGGRNERASSFGVSINQKMGLHQ